MSVVPFRITRTPSGFEHEVEIGERRSAVRDEVRAGPVSFAGSVGVFARAPPTWEPAGQLNGFAAKVASGHAFCSVLRREGSCLGSATSTDLMFACPEGWLIVVSRLAPFGLFGFPPVLAEKLGCERERAAAFGLEGRGEGGGRARARPA